MPFLANCGTGEIISQPALDQVNEIRQLEQTSNTMPLIPAEECIPRRAFVGRE